MLQSLMEQKRALGIYGSEHQLPDNLTAHQWALLEKTVSVLAPFEELTRKVSSSDSLASDTIPAVTVLLRLLNRETDEDHGIKTMKATLAAAVKRRFIDTEKNPLYCISTLLDPRYKDRFFSDISGAAGAKEMLKLELQRMSKREAEEEHGEPPPRKPRKAQPSSSLDSVFEEIADEQESTSVCCAPVGAAIQLETYLGETTTAREENPLQYWGVNKVRFPALAQVSQRYLSAPCSSVESERLFSSVSHIVDENRNRLTADNTEKLLFIKKNLPLTF
ncbi:zinc finger BED domain-containing protein 4-like [Melanotaenia boesemani]|nr:zinc finger BED domain-containing protein 4-like [Melanotaenia boesemani]